MPANAPGTLRRSRGRRLDRHPGANKPQPTTPISIVSATKSTNTLTVVFNQPVSLKGTPKYTTNLGGVTAISATMTNPTTLVVTFSATIATATTMTIPYEEPAVRNSSGGFVKDSTFPVT